MSRRKSSAPALGMPANPGPLRTGAAHGAAADLVNELRREVLRAIEDAPASIYPTIAGRVLDPEGYRQVEDAVIQVVLRTLITPSAALALLESEWGGIA